MASAFGHAFSAIVLGTSFSKHLKSWKFWLIGIVCSILPDADVISFQLGIPYGSFWGHRGFTHSLVFACIVGILVVFIFYRKESSLKNKLALAFYFFICTASHGLLDGLTNGGLGVAFFAPFDNTRYFLPWQPIQVSPIGAESFFGERGIRVIKSELLWIGVPGTMVLVAINLLKRKTNSKKNER